MASPPDRPRDDERRLGPTLGWPVGETADFLDRPADHRWHRSLGVLFGGGAVVFARCWITASRAKASITSETWRCQPCQLRVSVIEPELGLGGLEGVLDRPAPTLDADQHLERGAGRAPGGEVGQAGIAEAAPDEQATRPGAGLRAADLLGFEIRQLQIGPAPRSGLRPAGGQAPSRGPLVPSPAEARTQADAGKPRAISSAVPATGASPQDQNGCVPATPST